MSDHKRRSVLQQFCQAGLDQPFAFAVQVAGGFIEYQNLGVGQDRSGDRQTLPLTTRKFDTAFADDRVIAFGEFADEFVSGSSGGGLYDFGFGAVAARVRNVVANRAVKHEYVLFDDAQQSTVAGQFDVSQVTSIK